MLYGANSAVSLNNGLDRSAQSMSASLASSSYSRIPSFSNFGLIESVSSPILLDLA
ncbi:MAG: hypothetical protein Ct9H90mP6_02790 [Gammaproteobacteria bacterium]|nr:MAG: hypothetical protein Ct9H90mP6_02790 [Gammaproteobacteria bacterium]